MPGPASKSLVLDLLSTLRGGSMPVSALVAAGGLFDLAENSMRVAIARLHRSGQVERDERGRYRLGDDAAPIDRRVHSWRRLEERMRRWDGGWVAVHATATLAGRAERQRRDRALRLLGFEELERGLALRPDNLRGGVDAVRAELGALGLEPSALVFRMDGLEAATDARARTLWDHHELAGQYDRALAEVRESASALGRLSLEAGMIESFLLGGRVIRLLVLDPLLPEPIAPAEGRRALAQAMRHYDRQGRRLWATFMSGHDAPYARVPHSQSPADTRVGAGADRLHVP